MAQSDQLQLDSTVDEKIAALLEAVEARAARSQTSNREQSEAADTLEVSEESLLPPSNGGPPTTRVGSRAAPETGWHRRALLLLRRYLSRIARRRGALSLYLLGIAIGLLLGWLIPTLREF
jgi:hypothetical protein